MPDGTRFLLLQRERENQPLALLVVTRGWLDRMLAGVRVLRFASIATADEKLARRARSRDITVLAIPHG